MSTRPQQSAAQATRSDRSKNKAAATAGASLAGALSLARSAHAAGDDLIRIALIGCGGRGTGAAINARQNTAAGNVKLVAMADAFRSRLDNCFRAVQNRRCV